MCFQSVISDRFYERFNPLPTYNQDAADAFEKVENIVANRAIPRDKQLHPLPRVSECFLLHMRQHARGLGLTIVYEMFINHFPHTSSLYM